MLKNSNNRFYSILCVVFGTLGFLGYQMVLGQKGKWINYDEVSNRVIIYLSMTLVGLGVLLASKVDKVFLIKTVLIAMICLMFVLDFIHFSAVDTVSPVSIDATEMIEADDKKRRSGLHIEFRENNTCRFYEPREHGETYFETTYEQSGDTFFIDIAGRNPKMIPYQLVQKGDFMKGDIIYKTAHYKIKGTRYYSKGYSNQPLMVKEAFKQYFEKMASRLV